MSTLASARFQTALGFVRRKHAAIRYANGVPAWHHLARVSERLHHLLTVHNEGVSEDRETIVIASLGHDLLEDTDATDEEIGSIFNKQEKDLIRGATNEWGDEDVTPYVKKVEEGAEEVRLIKLADLCDNITAVAYTARALGASWITSYFLPTVVPMKNMVLEASFVKYPKTAAALKEDLTLAYTLLESELKRVTESEHV